MKSNERYYILRPETVESYFIMWRLTHDQKYRDWGWEMVQVSQEHALVGFDNCLRRTENPILRLFSFVMFGKWAN